MNQTVAKIGTFVVAAGLIGMLVYRIIDRSAPAVSDASDASSTSNAVGSSRPINRDVSLGHFGSATGVDQAVDPPGDGPAELPTLSVGVIGSTPMRREVTSIETLPVTDQQIRRMYRDASDRTCRIVIPGAPVIPPSAGGGRSPAGTYGRVPAMTIGLTLDAAAAAKLPTAVRSQVRGYLDKHRLSIQPTLYRDNMGQLYFGTDCQSAFYELDRPGSTVQAEAMINTAIGRLRALGVVGTSRSNEDPNFGRTLAMAFKFDQIDVDAATRSDEAATVTEVLLMHLPADTAEVVRSGGRPEIEIYITSGGRQTLNRIAADGRNLTSPLATIQSEVRFESMVLMGMYPAEPVVSSIGYQSRGVVSMEVVRRLIEGKSPTGAAEQTPLSLTEVLDQFGGLSDDHGV